MTELKLEHEQLKIKHGQEKETLLVDAQEAKDAAIKVISITPHMK